LGPGLRRPGDISAVAARPAENRAADGTGHPVLAVRPSPVARSHLFENLSQIDHDRKSSGRVASHRAFMDGNHRVAASHRLMRNFEKKRSPGFGPLPFLSCAAGRGQRLEQVALRDDVKASPGNRIQDGRIIDTARVVLAVLPGSGVMAGDR
jgi:hypothetical protein